MSDFSTFQPQFNELIWWSSINICIWTSDYRPHRDYLSWGYWTYQSASYSLPLRFRLGRRCSPISVIRTATFAMRSRLTPSGILPSLV